MHRLISNSIYQLAFEASKRTASRDLEEMVSEGIVEKVGTTGKGVHYSLRKGAKGAMRINLFVDLRGHKGAKGSETGS
jgi:predicted DNA-binding transcriptional regulator YafY